MPNDSDRYLERPPVGHGKTKHGAPAGRWTWTHEYDGDVVLKCECGIADGLLHGEAIWSERDGEVRCRGKYRAGRKVGTWKGWDYRGKVIWEASYGDDGVLTEVWEDGVAINLHQRRLRLPVLDEGVVQALDPDVVEFLDVYVGYVSRLPAALERMRRLEELCLENCLMLDFAPEARLAAADKKKLKLILNCSTYPTKRLADFLMEHGFGRWKISVFPHDTVGNADCKVVAKLGDEGLGDPALRRRLLALVPAGLDLAERYAIEGVELPAVAGTEELFLADVAKKAVRDAAVQYLEASYPSALAEHPIGPGASLYLMGTSKYYAKGELQERISEHGWAVVRKPEKATHAILMPRPRAKLARALDAGVPIVLESHLRELIEADAPVLAEDGSPAEQNLEEMLSSPDAANVKLGLQLLQQGTLPDGVMPQLLALMLFSPDAEVRAALRPLVLAKAGRKIAKRFDGDRRNYPQLTDGKKLRKLVREMSSLGVDGATFSHAVVGQFAIADDWSGVQGALLAALEYPESAPQVFARIADRTEVWLEDFRGQWPAGLSALAGTTSLVLSYCTLKGETTELAKMPRLEKLRLSGCKLDKGLLSLRGCTSLVDIDLGNTELKDFSVLSGFRALERLDLAGTGIQDMSPLESLEQLEVLIVEGCPVEDLSVLAKLKNLCHVGLSGTRVTNLEPLRQLDKLESITLGRTPVTDLSPLAGATDIEQLDLFQCTDLSDISPLRKMTKMRHLELRATGVSDLSPLEGMKRLESVHLYGSAVPGAEVKRLQKLLPQTTFYP